MSHTWSLTTKTHVILAGLNKDQVRTTKICYFDVNEFSTAAFWSFLLYNIGDRSTLWCQLPSYNIQVCQCTQTAKSFSIIIAIADLFLVKYVGLGHIH